MREDHFAVPATPGRERLPRFFVVAMSGDDLILRKMIELPKPAGSSSTDRVIPERVKNGCVLPAELAKRFNLISPTLSCYMNDSLCLVAVVGMLASPFDLYCLDRHSSKVLWKTSVWAEVGATPILSGQGFNQTVVISLEDERVLVYGCDTFGLYIEAFSKATGQNAFRFSTSY
jgi:hypothetical protein